MEKEGEHKERPGSARAQLPPHHLQRRTHGPGGDRSQGAGAGGEEETQTGEKVAEVPEQTSARRELPHARRFRERQRGLPVHRQRAAVHQH